jgi:TonB-linked SusC/RagA family outer membrane protein
MKFNDYSIVVPKAWLPPKLFLVMKLTALFLMITLMQVSAKSYGQKINLNETHVSLEKVLHDIEKQSGYVFLYSNEGIKGTIVDVQVTNASISEALKACLKNLSINYKIVDNNILLKFNEAPAPLNPAPAIIQAISIQGSVLNEKGSPLVGVTVHVKGTNISTGTDENGKFIIKAPGDGTLVFTYVGYIGQEVAIKGQTTIQVTLKEALASMKEVVVVAYGTTTKREISSAVTSLPMANVAQLPVQSINDAIGGRLAGVIVVTSNGEPGTKSQVSIRGGGTPLFVIDNIIRSQGDFENLNPNDIENYSILKDAAATSLYGPLGGNGVVLVTTKRGKVGQVDINYSYNAIFSQPTISPKKLSSYDKLNAINKVYLAEGLQQPTPDSILAYYKNQSKPFLYPNTDWRKIALKTWAPEQRHDLSLSSGTKALTYYASLSNYHQGSILKTDNSYNNRTTYRLNTVSDFDKIHLKVTTALDGYVETNSVPISSTAGGYDALFSHIQNHPPTALAYNNLGLPSANTINNPLVELSPLSGYRKITNRVFNSILGFDYAAPFLDGLHVKFTGNYNMWNSQSKSWDATAPSYADNSSTAIPGNPPSLTAAAAEGKTLLLQGFVTYNKTFGDHHIDFTGGYEQAKSDTSSLYATRQQYQILLDQFVAGPTVNQLAGGSEEQGARAGYIGRLGYNYKSKYFLEGTLRYDGSDLFPPGKRWGSFYALSGGWIISDESFMQSLKDKHILDFLKLRGSYGLTGIVDGISRFRYISGYSVDPNAWVIDGQPLQGTSEPGSIPSTSFSWYSIRSRNMGLDFTSLDNRLSGSFDYFYSRTTGFVHGNPIFASTLGIGLPLINFTPAALRREGAEFNLAWNSHIDQFTYKIGLNFTYANQLWERNPGENDVNLENPYTRVSGTDQSPLLQGYHALGYYTNNSDLLNGARRIGSINTVAGDLKYEDTNGDGKIDGSDFRNIGSNTFPRINYGTTIDLGYKGIFFSAVIMGSGNRDRYIGDVVQSSSTQGILVYGFQENYWTPTNTNALYPRQVSSSGVNGSNNVTGSDFWILKSRYVRLKSLQLGYDLKAGVLKRGPFKQLRVFVSGTNLLTISNSTKYFIDPESDSNNYGYPIQRTIALGLKAGF